MRAVIRKKLIKHCRFGRFGRSEQCTNGIESLITTTQERKDDCVLSLENFNASSCVGSINLLFLSMGDGSTELECSPNSNLASRILRIKQPLHSKQRDPDVHNKIRHRSQVEDCDRIMNVFERG